MQNARLALAVTALAAASLAACTDAARTAPPPAPSGARADPLVRMPGTQPGQVTLGSSTACYPCHGSGNSAWVRETADARGRKDYEEFNVFKAWQGSMMGNSARDPLMFACLTVAAQDSLHAAGNTDAVDICLRCHFPKGWLEGRSSVLNGSAMKGDDYDGIQCTFCHRLTDPLTRPTAAGPREGGSWLVNYDEQNSPLVPAAHRSDAAAARTLALDQATLASITRFSGQPFLEGGAPFSAEWDEAGGGQYFVSLDPAMRGPFADVMMTGTPEHDAEYSRFHKGPAMCGTCHDVSNPVVANFEARHRAPGDPTPLVTESQPAYAWSHVERTFSEYRLSAYAKPGGAPGKGNFRPNTPKLQFPVNGWETDQPGNFISKCQDCHMCSRYTPGTNDQQSPVRPEQSAEHPDTWTPCHAMTGGNVLMSEVLGSITPDCPPDKCDPVNKALLVDRADHLTMDPMQGTWTSLKRDLPAGQRPHDLYAAYELAATRNRGVLGNAASIDHLAYDAGTGALTFRIQNNTGHKLISGFPEGRRMFATVVVRRGAEVLRVVNPYDPVVGTLKGLPDSASSPALAANEQYLDELVYEVQMSSAITGESHTFHFALATGRTKDNRIPPQGFDVEGAARRQVEPVQAGQPARDYFTAAEYAGGYDEVSLQVPAGADAVEVRLYYQTTSREYVEFLRDEINGTGRLTLPASAYVAQSDPFFAGLRRWGDTIFALWERNKDRDGARPFLMTQAAWPPPAAPRAAARR